MKPLKHSSACALIILLSSVIVSCGFGGSSNAPGNSITFWAAPNPPQVAFWTAMARAYMASHHGISINVTAMPESPTSEAGIQGALAGGAAPTASENIFTGFAGLMVQDQALVPLNTLPGWDDLINTRHMTQVMTNWKFNDGHSYVLPIYSNAMLVGWRSDILQQLGYNTPPRTYSQVIAMGQKLKQKFPDKFVWVDNDLVLDAWSQRLFDFFPFYDAASNGHSFISNGQLTVDNPAAVDSLNFMNSLRQNNMLLTQNVNNPFETGVSVMEILGPWTYPAWAQQFPNLKFNKNYMLTPPPVPDTYPTNQNIKTYADSKGVVIYKQASQAQQLTAWSFIKWVFSDPQHDQQWLQKTNLPPARDDLSTNATFTSFFQQYPELEAYAKEIPYAVPAMKTPKYTDLLTALGDVTVIPVVKGQKVPVQAWNDWKPSAQSTLSSLS